MSYAVLWVIRVGGFRRVLFLHLLEARSRRSGCVSGLYRTHVRIPIPIPIPVIGRAIVPEAVAVSIPVNP